MRAFDAESGVEDTCLEYFADAGWQVLYGPDLAPGEPAAERSSYRDVLLEGRLRRAVGLLNPHLPPEVADTVVASVRRVESSDLVAENWRTHRLVTHGVPVEFRGCATTSRCGRTGTAPTTRSGRSRSSSPAPRPTDPSWPAMCAQSRRCAI